MHSIKKSKTKANENIINFIENNTKYELLLLLLLKMNKYRSVSISLI